MLNAIQQLGSALGIAVLATIFFAYVDHGHTSVSGDDEHGAADADPAGAGDARGLPSSAKSAGGDGALVRPSGRDATLRGVPLTLVTGPANAEKAGVVLDAYREQLARGAEPILVVPRFADMEHYRRELADSGAVFGVRVERFRGLIARARAARRDPGPPGRRAGARARRDRRDRADAAARGWRPRPQTPGFAAGVAAADRRARAAARRPAAAGAGAARLVAGSEARGAFAGELSALVFAYREALERLGRRDEELHTAAALDAIRLEPSAGARRRCCSTASTT